MKKERHSYEISEKSQTKKPVIAKDGKANRRDKRKRTYPY